MNVKPDTGQLKREIRDVAVSALLFTMALLILAEAGLAL